LADPNLNPNLDLTVKGQYQGTLTKMRD
jgi:hypothetical protein